MENAENTRNTMMAYMAHHSQVSFHVAVSFLTFVVKSTKVSTMQLRNCFMIFIVTGRLC